MVDSFIVIQLTFAEIFLPQDFTITTIPGLSGPANTCDTKIYKVLNMFVPVYCDYCH